MNQISPNTSQLHESAEVVRVEGQYAWVSTRAKIACSSCRVESTCGNGILARYLGGKLFVSRVSNSLGAQVGDQVTLVIDKRRVTRASMLVYLLPLFLMMAAALMTDRWRLGTIQYATSEWPTILGSLAGLALGFIVAYLWQRRWRDDPEFTPQMIAILAAKAGAAENTNRIDVKNC